VARKVEYTDQFEKWWDEDLTVEDQRRITAAVERLEQRGPTLGRPWVDSIVGSQHSNMKELRPVGTTIRVFFIFDPRRIAILLIGGDKAGRWRKFYSRMVRTADRLYDEHLEEIRPGTKGEN